MLLFQGGEPVPLRLLVVGAVAAAIALFAVRNSNEIAWDELRPTPALALGAITFVALLYINRSTQFLYFQF